jgi:hypothetical protein
VKWRDAIKLHVGSAVDGLILTLAVDSTVIEKNGANHGSSRFRGIRCTVPGRRGYSSMQIRNFSPFIQIPRTPLRATPSVRLMDAAPLRRPAGRGDGAERGIGEGNAGRAAGVSAGKQGMATNIRPDREIQHASDAPSRYSTYSSGDNVSGWCLHFRALSPPDLPANYRKDFDFRTCRGGYEGNWVDRGWNCRPIERRVGNSTRVQLNWNKCRGWHRKAHSRDFRYRVL